MKNKAVEEFKQKAIATLRKQLVYPNTTDEKQWQEAEKINWVILKAIEDIIKI